ncbi:MAG TPA: NADPH-dependent assimilatory sulfite reductase hemoprotein subunit, partial [Verrucomicrobiales bacterium]|nr:NADPH-dependent assimilatory sulfite reductase hemoprotein subunit [Verrucomicrobiales bacterium]
MSNQSVEEIKISSIGLRGTLAETLQSEATHFSDEEYQLLKFHGSYQQDDRDIRAERRKQKLDKLWSFMIRSKMPGGRINAAQYLMHDRLAGDVANGTLRLTTRQGIQFHGVFKGDLKEVIAGICESGLTTWGACGDVVRNTMGPASPIHDVAHRDCQALAEEMSAVFLPRSSAYSEIWLDGEKLELSSGKAEPDEIYGETYLPRKFKIGMAVPPRNDVDIFSQDVGMVPHVNAAGDAVEGYSIWVGGGFGMTHNMEHTRPHLAKPLCYAARADVLAVVKAVVQVQREHGNRTDRKLSRLKYVVAGQGIEWFRDRVAEKLPGVTLAPVREVRFTTVGDRLGW